MKKYNKLSTFFLIIAMLLAFMPAPPALAMSNPYSTPSWNPGSTAHPRVMFTSADIPKIKANFAESQNAEAHYYFIDRINNSSLVSSSVSLSSSVNSSLGTNADFKLEGEIEMFAFFYALYANDPEYGTLANNCALIAITRMQEYLNKYKYDTDNGMAYRNIGCTVFHASEVFDWCYNYSGFTQSNKDTMISSIETLAKKLDIWNSSANAPSAQGGITGHGSENQLLRDFLAFGIATAGHTTASGNSRNDIYNAVMGRIQAEYIAPRNDIYRSATVHQGSEYGWYRFYFDLYAEKLYETAASQSKNAPKTLFDTDLMKEVCYGMIYSRRADGRFFVEGDNKHTDYYYYNNFNRQTPKFAGDLFSNEYFKGEYRRTTGSEGAASDLSSNVFAANSSFSDNRSFNAVQWLIMNDPSVPFTTDRKALPKSRYFGSPIGKIYATTNWTYQQAKNAPFTSDSVSCEMKIGERYSANHDHLDAGTFQLFYKGLLTGDYGAEGDYGSSFDGNYYKRTVAHNAITINDDKVGFSYDAFTFSTLYKDGGQLGGTETSNLSTWQNSTPYKRASVVNHAIADDNSYSYIKGDITPAYGSKASEVARSMAFLPVSTSKAVMVVYDKVKSSQSSYDKKFLLHLAAEPTVTNNNKLVSDNTNTLAYSNGSVTYSGRLTMNTLLPASATITKRTAGYVSASGRTFTPEKTDSKYEPEWGYVEIAPNSTSNNTAYFLNVLTVSDAGTSVTDATLINTQSDTFVGAKTGFNQVVMFANTGVDSLSGGSGSFTIPDGSDLDLFVFGLGAGDWLVKKGSAMVARASVTAEGGALSVSGIDAGTYTITPFEASQTVIASFDASGISGGTWSNGSGGDPITFTQGDNAYNAGSGLYVNGSGGGASMPAAVQRALNNDEFSIEFKVTDLNITNNDLCASLIGNVKGKFAVYKVIGDDRIYIKMPGWRTVLSRPSMPVDDVIGHHNVITVDRTGAKKLKWYIDGELVQSYDYSTNDRDIPAVALMPEAGNSAVYNMINVYGVALPEGNAISISSE